MIVVNPIVSGGKKLPEGTTAIVQIFTANGTWTVPETGKYRVTVIGKGGEGQDGGQTYINDKYYYGNGGSGAGGVAQGLYTLSKGTSVTITVSNASSSFGSYLSATAGQQGSGTNGGQGGTASGGSIRVTGGSGKGGSGGTNVTVPNNGGAGGCYTAAEAERIPFLSTVSAQGGTSDATYRSITGTSGETPCVPAANGLFPFGCGGAAGGYTYSAMISGGGYSTGGRGASGAVIIEMVME